MPITINGSGTLTGVSVGGLPDGIVDTDVLANNAVTDAKQDLTGVANAWINFQGTSTAGNPFTIANGGIRSEFNISSVTDNGTGNYTLSFTTAMPNANYVALASGGNGSISNFSSSIQTLNLTASGFQILIGSDGTGGSVYTPQDMTFVSAAVFGG